MKIITILGTRPEIIRLSQLVPVLDSISNHVLVHTGQNSSPELSEIFFEDLNLRKPDFYFGVSNRNFADTASEVFVKSYDLLQQQKPDAVVVLGDTNSSMAAIVAERLSIPVYHLEAGNRSFDPNVPEEINRKLVDHVSTFNLAYSSRAYQNLLSEGFHPMFILKSGSPIREVLSANDGKIQLSGVLQTLGLKKNSYLVASIHRQENVDSYERLNSILQGVQRASIEADAQVIFSVHPRTKSRLLEFKLDNDFDFHFVEPFNYSDYISLQLNSLCVLSDSGTISEESAILKFPAVTLRDSMERQESLDSGTIIMSGIDPKQIEQSVLWASKRSNLSDASLPDGYEVTNFSRRVANFIFSTAGLANKWKRRRVS